MTSSGSIEQIKSAPIPQYTLCIALFVLSLIYLIIGIYCSTRMCKIFRYKNNETFLAQVFYLSIVLSCIVYMISMLMFFIKMFQNSYDQPSKEFQIFLYDTIYGPDAIFFVMYLTLYWKVLSLFYKGRIHSGNLSGNGIEKLFDPTSQQSLNRLQLSIFIYTLVQTIIIVLYNVNELNTDIYLLLNISLNALIPLSLIVSEIYLNIRFSGSPFRSKNFEKKTGILYLQISEGKLNGLLVFWALLRLVQIFLNSLMLKYSNAIYQVLSGTDNINQFTKILCVCFYVGDLVIVSVLPFILALGHTFIKIFLFDDQQLLLSKNEGVLVRDSNPHSDTISERISKKEPINNSRDSSRLERKLIQFSLQDINYQRTQSQGVQGEGQGFGKIQFGTLYNQSHQSYAFRELQLSQLSTYILDEVERDVKKVNEFKHDYLGHIYGWLSDNNKIIFLLKQYPNGSLSNLLFNNKSAELFKQMSKTYNESDEDFRHVKIKLNLAIQIARALNYLHIIKFPHGHLSCNNIMLNKNNKIKIVDLGFIPLKKYFSLTIGYTNKSYYTAPEIISERGKIVNNPTLEGDVYSFGMILYELFNEKIPFKDVSWKEIQQIVTTQNGRPKIEEKIIGDEISTLIRWCWQQDPMKRPIVDQILTSLENIQESIEN